MPLMHSKTPKAFRKNIEIEMEHGKPQKQAVAIAYSEKAQAEHKKHLARGGKVAGCMHCMSSGGDIMQDEDYGPAPDTRKRPPSLSDYEIETPSATDEDYTISNMASGGEVKGVHSDMGDYGGKKGVSPAGHSVRKMNEGTYKEYETADPKMEHQKVLGELKSMKKPNLYAEGGEVEDEGIRGSLDRNYYVKGVHRPFAGRGNSQLGSAAKGDWSYGDPERNSKKAKEEHTKVSGEAKGIKPNLYAEGGEVSGEMHMDEPMDDDSEIHGLLGEELMNAIEKKDSKAIMSCIEACVMQCMNKGEM